MGAKTQSKQASKVAAKLKAPKTPKADKAGAASKSQNNASNRLKTGLDPKLAEKAVDALLKFHEKQMEAKEKVSLLGTDRKVQVQFTLLRAPGKAAHKPIRVLIPHPLYKLADSKMGDDALEEPEICLIVKEESKPWCQEMIEKFPEHMGCVKKVLGLQSLRKKHATYAQRRELLHKYNFFMADDRILPMLSKALGKEFFKAKKLPVPINLTRKEALPLAIQKALSATFMTISQGTCITIRAGHTGMEPSKLVDNIMEIANSASLKIPHKWANIQVVSIKTPESIALPIYNKTPEILKELAVLAGIEQEIDLPPEESDEEEEDDATPKDPKKREMKSPLLRALKKQKKEEKEKQKKEKKSKKSVPEPAVEESATPETTEAKEEETPKARKKRSSSEGSNHEETKSFSKKKKVDEKKKEETSSKKKNLKKTEEATKQAEPSKREPKEEKGASKKKRDKKETDDGEKKEFIAARKFKKSMKGYVFKMGKQGLGYYVDAKPVVDKLAIDAILRMGKNSSRRGGQKKNKYKGTRRF